MLIDHGNPTLKGDAALGGEAARRGGAGLATGVGARMLPLPAQMRAMLRVGPGWPLTAWILLQVRGHCGAAVRAALGEVFASDPLFRLALVPVGSDSWTLQRRPPSSVPAIVDLSGVASGHATQSAARISRALDREAAAALTTTAFVMAVGEAECRVLVSMPAPCADRRTLQLVATRLGRALRGEHVDEPAAPDYLKVLAWQEEFLREPRTHPQRELWRRRLAGGEPARSHDGHTRGRPEDGYSRNGGLRSAIASLSAVASCTRRLDATLVDRIEMVARERESSPEAVFGAAWRIHVRSWLDDPPVAIAWEIAGRFTSKLQTALGCYARQVPLTAGVSPQDSFCLVLGEVAGELSFAREHVEYYDLGIDSDGAPSALAFDCAFAFEEEQAEDPSVASVDCGWHPIRFRVRLRVQRRGAAYETRLEYDAASLPRWRANLLSSGYLERLRACLADPDARLDAIPAVSARQRHCILAEWNDAGDPPATQLVPARIRAACVRHRDRVALVSPEGAWTYGRLGRRVSAIARRLSRRGVGRGARVALLVERSPDAIAAMLATLEAGAAYVPISPDQPAERIAAILADCEPAAVLTTTQAREALPPVVSEIVLLDAFDADENDREPRVGDAALVLRRVSPPAAPAAPGDPAYILYTSGSTGTPKGVVITHANLAESLGARLATYQADDPGFFLASPLIFDSSVAGIYWTLAVGGRLCLPPDRIHDRFDAALDLLRAGRVTHALFLPSLYRLILDRAAAPLRESFETIILAGEEVPPDIVDLHRRQASGAELFNEYGLTESSVWSTVHRIPAYSSSARIPIGRPVPGARVYVLDENVDVCPAGREGDLYLGGAMVSPGYWRMPAETATKFVPDAFAGVPGARMCRTGDRAGWRAEGTLEFLGRADRQVKVRGVRVELAEIEHLLARQSWIAEAAAIATPAGGHDLHIQAFVVARQPHEARAGELEGIFRRALPPQLLPIPVTLLDALPRTATGKVDRTRLVPKTIGRRSAPQATTASRSPVGELIAGLWKTQLGMASVSDADSFWETGGNSIKAIPIIASIQRLFGVELGLRALFEAPTLGALTRRVEFEMRVQRELPSLAPLQTDGRAPLSFAQRRLWFLEKLQPGRTAYHCPIAIRADGVFSVAAWEQTMGEIARVQESLRTVIRADGERAELDVRQYAPERCACVDLSGLAPTHREAAWRRLSRAEAVRAFDLERERPWRQRVARFGDRGTGVVLNFHHVACDLWSMEILIRNINALYPVLASGSVTGRKPLERTYSDFARRQQAWLSDARSTALVDRWRELLGPSNRAGEIPTDFPRPRSTSGRARRLEFSLGADVSARVLQVAREEQATPFLVLLAACHALVAGSSGSRDTCVGVPVANRAWQGGDEVVGLLLNTLPVPARLSPAADFRALLGNVRDTFLSAFAMQDLPFERIVEALGFARDPRRNPAFQVFFTYQNRLASDLRIPAAKVAFDGIQTGAPKFDLTLSVAETDRGFDVVLEYDGELFAPTTAARLAYVYRHLVATCCSGSSAKLDARRLMPSHAHHQVMTEWNDTDRGWDSEATVHELFGEAARRAPDRVAVIDGEARMTFGALDAWSNDLAAGLEALGLASGEAIGIWSARSAKAVAAMLGALKAGLTFVPLDPETPPTRLRQAAEDTGMRFALSDRPRSDADLPFRVIPIERVRQMRRRSCTAFGGRTCDAAYILFTSGSTARPKGVRGSHRAIVNRFRWMWDRQPVEPGEVFCSKAPLTFVDSLWEVFGGLLQGAALFVVPDEAARDPRALVAALSEHDVTRVVFIPSFLRLLLESVPGALDALPSLRQVTVSGEQLEPSVVRLFHAAPGRAELLNLYGMTEAAADVTWHVPQSAASLAEPVPIGRPLANVQSYLLDHRLDPVGVGVPAELFIGGDALADGYVNAPSGTALRFVPHPFPSSPGARLYRTGDLCAWQPDGRLRYLGRCDRQLKVRGMRVEPVEIEERLRLHPLVLDAVVRGVPSAAGVRLIAYLRLDKAMDRARMLTADERADVRRFLAAALPSQMIPSELVAVPALPRTASGKIDSRALPLPEDVAREDGTDGDEAASILERRIQHIWKNVLSTDAVPLDANFFDVGGNSFHLIQVQSRLKSELGLDVQVFDMFAHPSVKDFAAFVAGSRGDGRRARAFTERIGKRRAALVASQAPGHRSWT